MKKAILIAGALVVFLGFAKGQPHPVPAATFKMAIGDLNTAINDENVEAANYDMEWINGMMNEQMAYMKGQVAGLQAKYAADTAAYMTAMRAYYGEILAVEKAHELHEGNEESAQENIAKSKDDRKQATEQAAAANADKRSLVLPTAKLNAEQQAYDKIQEVKANIIANRSTIISQLKTFAATLQ